MTSRSCNTSSESLWDWSPSCSEKIKSSGRSGKPSVSLRHTACLASVCTCCIRASCTPLVKHAAADLPFPHRVPSQRLLRALHGCWSADSDNCAGSTAQTAAESLRELGARELHFANRTAKNATRLAAHFDGSSGSLDDLLITPPNVDAIIVAISGRKLRIPVAKMPGLQTVVDLSQPAVATGLEEHAHVHHLDLDGLAQLEQQREIHMETWCEQASALASEEADRIWSELQHGRVDLGQLLGLHVEMPSRKPTALCAVDCAGLIQSK